MTPDPFIDDVARAMTDVDAPARLRSRVLAELESTTARRRQLFAWPAVAAGALMAAIILSRPWFTPSPHSAWPPAPEIQSAEAASATVRETTPAETVVHRRTPAAVVSVAEKAWLARALPPLVTQDVVIPTIQPTPMSIAPIAVEPIELGPISMPPVGGGTGERR